VILPGACSQSLQKTISFASSKARLVEGVTERVRLEREVLGRKDRWPFDVHPKFLLTFRLSPLDVGPFLSSILKNMEHLELLPRFQLDFPFPLLPSLLSTIFPTLTSILQHPSLPSGRDFILKHTGNTKKITFGTQTEKDASALRAKIEELGELEIVVEVVVLEL